MNIASAKLPVLAAGLTVSLVSLGGMFVLWMEAKCLQDTVPYSVGLAVGLLLGDAFIHLISEAIGRSGSVSVECLTVLLGVFAFDLREKRVRWRHHHRVDFDAAGGVICIGASDLIPALHECSTPFSLSGQAGTVGLGSVLMQKIVIFESFLIAG